MHAFRSIANTLQLRDDGWNQLIDYIYIFLCADERKSKCMRAKVRDDARIKRSEEKTKHKTTTNTKNEVQTKLKLHAPLCTYKLILLVTAVSISANGLPFVFHSLSFSSIAISIARSAQFMPLPFRFPHLSFRTFFSGAFHLLFFSYSLSFCLFAIIAIVLLVLFVVLFFTFLLFFSSFFYRSL